MTPDDLLRALVWLALASCCGLFWTVLLYVLTGDPPLSSCAGSAGFLAALAFGAWLCQGIAS